MGNNLFGVDIAGILADVFTSQAPLLDATLHRREAGTTRDPNNVTAGIAGETVTDFPCTGFIDDYQDKEIDGTLIQVGDRRILLLGNTIAGGTVRPERKDQITIEGQVHTILRITRDPDAATYVCQTRG